LRHGKDRPVIRWGIRDVGSKPLEARIESHSGASWHFPAVRITQDWLKHSELKRIEVIVGRADRTGLKLKVDTENTGVLNAEALPDWDPDFFDKLPSALKPRPADVDEVNGVTGLPGPPAAASNTAFPWSAGRA
jgi:hypothetical protein